MSLLEPRSRKISLALCALFALLLASCGGQVTGGGGASTGTPDQISGTGVVALLITDAPSDEFDAIEVTVSRIELLGDERVEIFSGLVTFDLLQLERFSKLLVVADGIPPGPFDKIRMTLEELVLVREVDDGRGGVTREEMRPSLPGNGKLDLLPRESFTVPQGEMLPIEIDMDARRSLHAHESGNGEYRFRPVVFVKIVRDMGEIRKFARVNGIIRRLSEDRLLLCSLDTYFEEGKELTEDGRTRRKGRGGGGWHPGTPTPTGTSYATPNP